MAEPLFDDAARALRRQRALTRASAPFLAERVVEELVERLVPVRRRFATGLVTGCPPALHQAFQGAARTLNFADSVDALAGHREGSLDLLIIIGELDARDELPLLLKVARSRLRSGALLSGAMAGGHSLPALRASLHAADSTTGAFAARTHPRVEAGALAGLLGAAGFVEPVVDVDRVRLRYRSLRRLVDDLRDHAATNSLHSRPRQGFRKAQLAAAEQAFAALAEEGTTEERIEILHYAAWTSTAEISP